MGRRAPTQGRGREDLRHGHRGALRQQQPGSDQTSRFAIVLDGEVLSAPTTNGHFTDGASQISGNFTAKSARALANQLKYGALPLTFELNGSSFEGPTLAGTQLKAGLYAGAVGWCSWSSTCCSTTADSAWWPSDRCSSRPPRPTPWCCCSAKASASR